MKTTIEVDVVTLLTTEQHAELAELVADWLTERGLLAQDDELQAVEIHQHGQEGG